MKAILFTIENIWVLQPTVGMPRHFATACAAKTWAKMHRIIVKRATTCDSI